MIISIVLVLVVLATAGVLLLNRRLNRYSSWQAMMTPLASIMGSGFLVSAPLLAASVGSWAVICMAGLLVVAFAVGSVIRFNIRWFEPIEFEGHGTVQSIAFLSRIVLAGAYFISISYYLQLLAVFALSYMHIDSQYLSHWITTILILIIGGVGFIKGLGALEKVEKIAVSFNLAMILSLLIGLVYYNMYLASNGTWSLPAIDSTIDLHDVRILLGLLIVVQGFETSRYLGSEHSAEERIKTMRWAQLLSAAIYLIFISLCTVLFNDQVGTNVSDIIIMIVPVAMVLPIMVMLAAFGSQFSAAVADTAGAGGLIRDLSHNRLPIKYAYVLIVLVTVVLTWESNVNTIISYASRAFALYYFLQSVVSLLVIAKKPEIPRRFLRGAYTFIVALVCFAVFLFGVPAE